MLWNDTGTSGLRGRVRWLMSVGLLACGLASGSAMAQTAAPIKVGVIGPFTGPSSDFGIPMLNGIRLATEEINAVGGYLGRPLELVVKDDQGNPDTGLRESEALVREGVIATIGFCNTGVAMKALDVYQKAQVPLIVPCATGTPVTSKFPAPESYIFRTSARDAIQAPFVVQDLVRRGWTRVAIFADTTGYGEAGLKDVEAAMAARNLKPVHVARFGLGGKTSRPNWPPRAQRAPTWCSATPWAPRTRPSPTGGATSAGMFPRWGRGPCRSRSSSTVRRKPAKAR